MFTKTKIALVATFLAASSTLALASDWDLYPTYDANGNVRQLQSAPVQLQSSRNAVTVGAANAVDQQDPIEVDRNDHASSPYAGGGF